MKRKNPAGVYLDNAATTRVRPEVREALGPFFDEEFGNPSSLHAYGVKASQRLERAREELAGALGLPPSPEVAVFTGSATEANNLLVKGMALVAPGRRLATRPPHALTSRLEHASVAASIQFLAERGWDVEMVNNDDEGRIDPDHLISRVRPETRLVTLIWGNNEIGTVLPARLLAARVRAVNPRCVVHFDAVQCLGKIDLRIGETEIDALTLSGHKVHGPKGVGALVFRRPLGIGPLVTGGGQEGGFRSGTENVAFSVAMSTVVGLSQGSWKSDGAQMGRLRDRLSEDILGGVRGARVLGDPESRLPHIVSVTIDGVRGEVLLHHLEKEGIFVSTGAACRWGDEDVNPVLQAVGLSDQAARSTLRFSLSRETVIDEIDRVVRVLPGLVEEVRR